MKAILILIPILLLGIFSCDPMEVIEGELNKYDNKLVVDAKFSNNDTAIHIIASRSSGAMEPIAFLFEYRLQGIIFNLFEDGIKIEDLSRIENNHGIYFLNYRTKPGKHYKITAFLEGYETITAESYIPEKIPNYIFQNTQRESMVQLTIRIVDPPDEANYYSFDLVGPHNSNIYFEYFDPLLNFSVENDIYNLVFSEVNTYGGRMYFSDYFFNGQEYEFIVNIPFNFFYNSYFFDQEFLSEYEPILYLKFYSLSEDYFLYEKTKKLANKVKNDRYAEPVNVYSNVNNGFGLFAGYHLTIDSLRISDIVLKN